jgi:hypothetical protein
MSWQVLETAAPELAALGWERLDRVRIALLATLRKDGCPRISPVEPYLSLGELLFGSMSWSLKTRDLERDPRCALHSAITGPDSGEGEFKLYGRALEAEPEMRRSCRDGWWYERAPNLATVFALEIAQAVFISWDGAQGQMTVRRWSRRHGYAQSQRSYP